MLLNVKEDFEELVVKIFGIYFFFIVVRVSGNIDNVSKFSCSS